jgi:hypothetical protein
VFDKVAYCESPKITEEAFLRREFGITTIYVSSIDDFLQKSKKSNSDSIVIVSTNPLFWVNTLNRYKKDSVIFILIGNETYDPKVFNLLNNLKSLRHAFVYNLPTSIKARNIFGPIVGNIIDGGFTKTHNKGSVYRDARISYSLISKFKNIKINYSCSRFPQGYSNNFAGKMGDRIGIKENESLLDSNLVTSILKERKNIYNFAFIGQPTNRRRETFLKNIKKVPKSIIIYNEGFKGIYEDTDLKYLEQLLSSKFILIPPGFYNNSNHRYTESLICNTVPVILANNSLDPSSNNNWTNDLFYINRYSVKAQLRYLSNIDRNKYDQIYNLAKSSDFGQIADTKKLIFEIL